MPNLAITTLPWDLAPGDPFLSDDGVAYAFERVDPDGVVYLRARINSGHGDLLVTGSDGMPRRPICEELLELISEGTLTRVVPPPQDIAAQDRRKTDANGEQARALDEVCDFRIQMLRALDDALQHDNQSRSDRQLEAFIAKCLRKKEIGRLPGAWKCSPATLRHWWRTRGAQGSRRTSDGISRTGRSPKARKIDHPVEIIAYWSSKAAASRAPTLQIIREYRAELDDINNGRPLHRFRAEIGEGGVWSITREPVNYEKPTSPYLPMSQDAFYSLVRTMRSKKSYAIETSAKGARQRYEGGGVSETPSRIGVLGQIDDTPVPNLFLVDDDTSIPLGGATLTLMIDTVSRLLIGWDLSWEHASTNTVLRTVLHSNRPKYFPATLSHFVEEHTETELEKIRKQALTWGYRVSRLLGDNLTGYHSREVEDALLDATISHEFTEKHRPRAKPHVERVLGTLQQMLFKRLPDSRFDSELAQRFGYDPDVQVLCTLKKARELLDMACIIYNTTRHDGLDGKQPSLVHQEHLCRYRVPGIVDEAILKRALMRGQKEVEVDNSGVRVFGQRYSEAGKTSKLIEDHERCIRKRCNHGGPDQKRFVRSHKRKMTFKVRIKYDPDDLGAILVWNPHALPQGEWVKLRCVNQSMIGRPQWLHERILELAKQAADRHLDKTTEDRLHAALQREITNVTDRSSERNIRDHAKAMDTPHVAKSLQNWIEVRNEDWSVNRSSPEERYSGDLAEYEAKESALSPIDVDLTPRKDGLNASPRPRRRRSANTEDRQSEKRRVSVAKKRDETSENKPSQTKRRRYGGLAWKDIV
jgi:hypothetical protein